MDKPKEESLNSNEKKREYFEKLVDFSLDYNPIQKVLIKHPIFLKIIGGIRKTDIRALKRAEMIYHGEKINDKDKIKITREEEIFFISKIVQYAAMKAGSGLLCMNGKLYYYDKAKWTQFSENDATEFMSLAAQRIGLHQSYVGQIKNKTNKDFTNSEFCNKMIDEYQQKTNSVYRFITEEGWLPSVDPRQSERISADASNSTQLKEFYNDYTKYCQNTGVNKTSYPDFRKKIRQYFYVQPNCTNNQTLVFVKKRSDLVDLKTKEPGPTLTAESFFGVF